MLSGVISVGKLLQVSSLILPRRLHEIHSVSIIAVHMFIIYIFPSPLCIRSTVTVSCQSSLHCYDYNSLQILFASCPSVTLLSLLSYQTTSIRLLAAWFVFPPPFMKTYLLSSASRSMGGTPLMTWIKKNVYILNIRTSRWQ